MQFDIEWFQAKSVVIYINLARLTGKIDLA